MPSGKAGLTTRISTTITPIRMPNTHLPVLVMEADTGSVAMKIMPKAQPPTTMCQYQGIPNRGLVSEPIRLNRQIRQIMTRTPPESMHQEATLLQSRTHPPRQSGEAGGGETGCQYVEI